MTESQNNAIGSPRLNDLPLKSRIIAEILKVYPTLPEEFRAYELSRKVRANVYKYELHFPYDDSVMRYFRQLREDGVIKCDCLNRQKSLYKKQTT